MPGIDKNRFINLRESDDELVCGICLAILTEPIETPCCRQTYCSDCINQWLISRKVCPNDRKSLNARKLLKPSRIVINTLNMLEMRCDFSDKGCDQVISFAHIKSHVKTCAFGPNNNEKLDKTGSSDWLNKLVNRILNAGCYESAIGINIKQWAESIDVIDCFECLQVCENGYKYASYLGVSNTHLLVFCENVNNKGYAKLIDKTPLDLVVQITSKKQYPQLVTIKYGHRSDGLRNLISKNYFIFADPNKVITIIRQQLNKITESSND